MKLEGNLVSILQYILYLTFIDFVINLVAMVQEGTGVRRKRERR